MTHVSSPGRTPQKRKWGVARQRKVSRLDRPVNWFRRARSTRQDHQHHHDKTKRMQH